MLRNWTAELKLTNSAEESGGGVRDWRVAEFNSSAADFGSDWLRGAHNTSRITEGLENFPKIKEINCFFVRLFC